MVESLQVDSKTEKLYIDVNGKTVTIEKTGNNAYLRAYKQGKIAIKGYWWGTRIWISKSAANNISTGISIGGVFIKSNLTVAIPKYPFILRVLKLLIKFKMF